MKSTEVKERVASGFGKLLKEDGFVYKKTKNLFLSQREEFDYFFIIEQLSWSDHFSINVHLAISQKKIENILEKIICNVRDKYTFWQDIARIYKSPDHRQIINGNLVVLLFQDEDVEATVESLEGYYENIARPYFKRYESLEAIDDIMNNPPYEYCPADIGGGFDNRCMKGLIVARLVNNPNYNNLLNIYDEEIKGTMNEKSIENYYKVREYLSYTRII